jgi:hypothetical protein
MPRDPNEQGCEDCGAEDDPERGLRQVSARRALGELARDEFKIAFDQSEVTPRLIGLPQREGVFICHAARYGRTRLLDREHIAQLGADQTKSCYRPVDLTTARLLLIFICVLARFD